jgi:hypothetical protein
VAAPLEAKVGLLVVNEMVCCALMTWTVVLPDTEPLDAVTVMTVPEAAPLADTVAVATPFAPVGSVPRTIAPEFEEKVIVAPATALLSELSAVAVIVAEALPSAGMVATLLTTEMVARFAVGPVPLEEQVEKLPQLPPPPQLASAAKATEANTHFKIRMFIT